MSSPLAECPRRSRSTVYSGEVASPEQQHVGHRRRSFTGGNDRLVTMTRITVIAIIYLSLFYAGVQSVDGFAVVHSTPGGSTPQSNSEVIQNVEQYITSEQNDDGKIRIRRKATSGGKPATCTCTCETAMVHPAASASGKQTDEKLNKEASQPQHQTPLVSSRYAYRQQQQQQQQQSQQSQQQQHDSASGKTDVVSSDQPTKTATADSSSSHQSSSSSLSNDYDEALGIFYGKQSQHNHNRDKFTSDQIITDLDSVDSRHPWLQLSDRMCFREPCSADRDCCIRYNICDRSAHVCTDCWYGNPCMSPRDCCQKYPHCQRPTTAPSSSSSSAATASSAASNEAVGRCVSI